MRCGVITVSNSRTEATDDTGRGIREALERAGHMVAFYAVVKDDVAAIRGTLEEALREADVVLTNGGTGLAPTDVTLEALEPLWSKRLEGFGEIFRWLSYREIGTPAMMSRAAAGVIQGGFVACLPGSPSGARMAVEQVLLPELGHIVGLLVRAQGEACTPAESEPGAHAQGAGHDRGHGDEGHGPTPGHDGGKPHGMRPLGHLIPLEEAMAKLLSVARPVDGVEVVPLLGAAGRVLAEEVVSPADVPSSDRSAVDGYAVIAADTEGATPESPRVLHLQEVLHVASLSTKPLGPGRCAQVATGSAIPEGADAVVMVEFTKTSGDEIKMLRSIQPGRDLVRRGEDIRRGERVLGSGETLTPGRIGAAAALGIDRLRVHRRPRVGIVTTGDELVPPGKPLPPGGVYDINTYTLAAVVSASGGEPVLLGRAGDTLEALRRSFEGGMGVDLVVFSGGSSAGERDLVVDLVREKGEVIFHGIAIKPGRPTLLGVVGSTPVLGMPGFPTSALSNAYLLLRPMVRRMAHLAEGRGVTLRLPLAEEVTSALGRTDVVPVRLEGGKVRPVSKGSASITSMAPADGYFIIRESVERVEAGTEVEVYPL